MSPRTLVMSSPTASPAGSKEDVGPSLQQSPHHSPRLFSETGTNNSLSLSTTSAGSPRSVANNVHPTHGLSPMTVGMSDDPNVWWRPSMEDATVALHLGNPLHGLFCAIYDGHGGKLASQIAKCTLHKLFSDEVGEDHVRSEGEPFSEEAISVDHEQESTYSTMKREMDTVGNALANAYRKLDEILRVQRCFFVGTTAVTAYLRKVSGMKVLTVANCGDSRGVLAKNGNAVRVTEEHRPVEVFERERIRELGGFVSGDRVNGMLGVSRALGDHAMKRVVVSTPHVKHVVLTDAHEFLILACDGLWDVVSDQRAVDIVQRELDAAVETPNPQLLARKLVKEAIGAGSTDNVSVLVVLFDPKNH